MAGYLNEPWGYCERSGFKVPLRNLVRDGELSIWCDRRWADRRHPQKDLRPIGPDYQHVDPVTTAELNGLWQAASAPLTLSSVATGYSRSSIRVVIDAGRAPKTGRYMRLKLTSPSTAQTIITAACIGQGGKSTPYAFSDTPAVLRYAGSSSFVIPMGETIATDRMIIPIITLAPIVVSFDIATPSIALQSPLSGYTLYSKANSQEAWAVVPSGYSTTASTSAILAGIEILDATDDSALYWDGGQIEWGGQMITWGGP